MWQSSLRSLSCLHSSMERDMSVPRRIPVSASTRAGSSRQAALTNGRHFVSSKYLFKVINKKKVLYKFKRFFNLTWVIPLHPYSYLYPYDDLWSSGSHQFFFYCVLFLYLDLLKPNHPGDGCRIWLGVGKRSAAQQPSMRRHRHPILKWSSLIRSKFTILIFSSI